MEHIKRPFHTTLSLSFLGNNKNSTNAIRQFTSYTDIVENLGTTGKFHFKKLSRSLNGLDVNTAVKHLGSLHLNPKLQGEILQAASKMDMLESSAEEVSAAIAKLGIQSASAFASLGPMLTGFFTSPVGMIAAATAATVGILALIDHFTVTRDKALASAQEASQNFKNTQEELSSLDSQYQANQKRITELNALKSNGTITASGRSELEMLEKENIALKTQINSKNTLQDMEQQKETGIYRKCIPSDRYLSLFNRDSLLIRNPLTIICSTCIAFSMQPERRISIE